MCNPSSVILYRMKPLISVVIPCGNDNLRLRWCLEGLACQSLRAFETIAVNDGGPHREETQRVVSSVRVRLPARYDVRYQYLNPPSRDYRVGAARNLGARYAKADLIVFVDGDIVLDPGVLQDYADHYYSRRNGRKEIYYTQRRRYPLHLVKELSELRYRDLWRQCDDNLFKQSAFYTFCVGVPREPFLEMGGFDTGFTNYAGEDIDLRKRFESIGYRAVDISTDDREHGWVTHLEHTRGINWRPADCRKDEYRALVERNGLVRNGGPLISVVNN